MFTYERNKFDKTQLFSTLLTCFIDHSIDQSTLLVDLHCCIQNNVFSYNRQPTPVPYTRSMFISEPVVLHREKQQISAVEIVDNIGRSLSKRFKKIVFFTHFRFDRDQMYMPMWQQCISHFVSEQFYPSVDKQPDTMEGNLSLLSELLKFIIKQGDSYAPSICVADATMIFSRNSGEAEFTTALNRPLFCLPSFDIAQRIINYHEKNKGFLHLKSASQLTLALLGLKMDFDDLSHIVTENHPLLCDSLLVKMNELLEHKLSMFQLSTYSFPLDIFFKSLCILSIVSCLGYERDNEYLRPPSFEKLFLVYMRHRHLFVPLLKSNRTILGTHEVEINKHALSNIVKTAILGNNCNEDFEQFFIKTKANIERSYNDKFYNNHIKYQSIINTLSFINSNIVDQALNEFVCLIVKFI